jgi:hypothetical protein
VLSWLLAGVLWAARTLIALAAPVYYDPVTALDWAAVWLTSAQWPMLGLSVILLGRLTASTPVRAVSILVALGAVLVGGGNANEDGFGVPIGGAFYIVGFFMTWLGLLPLAATLWRARYRRLAGLSLALLLAILLINVGGGFVILGGLGALAAAPTWFARSEATSPRPGPCG